MMVQHEPGSSWNIGYRRRGSKGVLEISSGILPSVQDAQNDEFVPYHPVDDVMRFVAPHMDGLTELVTLRGCARVCRQPFESPFETVEVAIRVSGPKLERALTV
jgi:hypothetical protein